MTQTRLPAQLTILLAVVSTAAVSEAQDYRAKVQGTVIDSSGAVIVGARLTLTNNGTGVATVRSSQSSGQYIFGLVEPGSYTLTAESAGFNKYVEKDITVQVRADVTIDVVLTVGDLSQELTVTAAATSALQFNTSTMDLTVDRKMLMDLPVLARNPFTLALLSPGVVNRYWAERNPFFMWSSSSIDIGGNTSGMNDLLLDGAPLMLSIKGSYAPPMDAVQEFTVQQNSVDAEFGHGAGGIMSLSTRSGTNAFHGTAYYFGRNPALNAVSNAITRAPNEVRNHIWGGTLGNPLVKGKLFTFTAWEQWRTREPRTMFLTLPTDLEREGDFSRSLNADGSLRLIYDPWSTRRDANGNYVRTPFPGNRIPTERMHPTALRFLQDIWRPNNPGDDLTGANNFKANYAWTTDYWNFSNRTDWNISDKWKVFGRYSQFHNDINEVHPFTSPALPYDEGGAMYSLNVAANSVYIPNSAMFFDVGASYASLRDDYSSPISRSSEEEYSEFWPDRWFAPYTKDLEAIYYPHLILAGKASFGHRFFWIEHPKSLSFHAKVSMVRGSHDMKAGLQFRRIFGLINYPDPMSFTFDAAMTADTFISPNTRLSGDPYATFLLGALDSASRAQYVAPHEIRSDGYGLFFQDNIRLNRRVTLNLGLRYDYETAPVDRLDRVSRYLDLNSAIPEMQAIPPVIPDAVRAIADVPYRFQGAWVFADETHRGIVRPSKLRFQPRVGAAIRISDNASLRLGYGRYSIPVLQTQPVMAGFPLAGFTASTTVAPAIEGIPSARLSDPFPETNPLILPTGKSLGRYQNLGSSASWIAQDFRTGVSDRIHVSFQRELVAGFYTDVTYFLNLAHDLPYAKPLNMVDPQLSYTYRERLLESVPNPFFQYLTPERFPGQLRNQQTVTIGSLLRPYPQYGDLWETATSGVKTRYQAIQLRVQRPFTKGLSLLLAYNYSREKGYAFFNALDEYAGRFTYRDSNNPRHRMNLAGTYDLPFGRDRALLRAAPPLVDAILGGWSTSFIFSFNSGPFLRFPQAIVEGNPRTDTRGDGLYLDTSKVHVPAPFTPRTNPYQYEGITGPSFWNIDATLSKAFRIRERYSLEWRMDAYNLTNSFMPGAVDMNVYSSRFGRSVGQANRGRELQYSLRLRF